MRIRLFITFLAWAIPLTCVSDTYGPLSASTGLSNDSEGVIEWQNPGNIGAEDSTYAIGYNVGGGTTQYLTGSGFSFSLPAGSSIDGIIVSVTRYKCTAEGVVDSAVRLIKAGILVGDNKADTENQWPSASATATYGSSMDLWGETWTADDINNSKFGVAVSSAVTDTAEACADMFAGDYQALVDHISITVTYTAPATVTGGSGKRSYRQQRASAMRSASASNQSLRFSGEHPSAPSTASPLSQETTSPLTGTESLESDSQLVSPNNTTQNTEESNNTSKNNIASFDNTPPNLQTPLLAPEPLTIEDQFESRICQRVDLQYSGNLKILGRINRRLERRWGFKCGE